MTPNEIMDEVRWLALAPSEADVSTFRISTALRMASDRVTQEIGNIQVAHAKIPLKEGERYYAVPEAFVNLQASFYNGQKLPWSNVGEFQSRGIDYMGCAAKVPEELIVAGNQFIVYPPPSETAMGMASEINIRYERTALPWNNADGLQGYTDAQVRTVIVIAAQWVLSQTPACQTPQGQMRLKMLADDMTQRLALNTMQRVNSGEGNVAPLGRPKNYAR